MRRSECQTEKAIWQDSLSLEGKEIINSEGWEVPKLILLILEKLTFILRSNFVHILISKLIE